MPLPTTTALLPTAHRAVATHNRKHITMSEQRPPRERGPAAQRGLRFSKTPLPELLAEFGKAKATLRLLDTAKTSSASGVEELDRIRNLNVTELARLRRETLELLTDLRAELRRRGET